VRNRRASGVAALLAIGLLASACSSSGTPGSDRQSSHTTATGTPIPVGTVGTFSGPLASSIGAAKASVEAWAAELNANGGIDGHPIKLFVEDDAGNVAQSLTAAKKLVEQDHVVAIVGQASGNAAPWADYVKQKGIPVVGGNPASDLYTSNDDFFAIGGNPLSTFYGVGAVAKRMGTKLGTLYCAELPTCANTVGLFQAFGKSTGVELAYSAKVSASAPDFIAPCQGLKDAGVQSYILSLAAATQLQVAQTCKQQGLKAVRLVGNTADSNMLSNAVDDGALIVNSIIPFADESTPASKALHDALRKHDPQIGTDKQPLNQHAVQGYISGKLFEAAVKASADPDVTPASVKKGLYALKGETLGGLTVPLTYTQGKPTLFNCYFISQVKAGQFVEPNGLTPECAPNDVIQSLLNK
jgi:branched-chain amino acid transport system substrate-binding protein